MATRSQRHIYRYMQPRISFFVLYLFGNRVTPKSTMRSAAAAKPKASPAVSGVLAGRMTKAWLTSEAIEPNTEMSSMSKVGGGSNSQLAHYRKVDIFILQNPPDQRSSNLMFLPPCAFDRIVTGVLCQFSFQAAW